MAALKSDHVVCPMCTFSDEEYSVTLHLEEVHFAEDSPFIIRDGGQSLPKSQNDCLVDNHVAAASQGDPETEYVTCPEEGCGEEVLWIELQEHLDLHLAEKLTFEEAVNMHSLSEHHSLQSNHSRLNGLGKHSLCTSQGKGDNPQATAKLGILRKALTPGSALQARSSHLQQSKAQALGRLGKNELGPYAFEKRMPDSVYRILERDSKVTVSTTIGKDGRLVRHESMKNQTPGILPVLAQLFEHDQGVSKVYLCHSSLKHISKSAGAPGFCGYQTTQMLISYIHGTKAQGHQHFSQGIPGILQMQDSIEAAWDLGINVSGRVETGGVRQTRKWIGTAEAQAFFTGFGIDCNARTHIESSELGAHDQLLKTIQQYFVAADNGQKVCKTVLPPVYLQRQGHSVAIIGYEIKLDGTSNLLIFDSLHKPAPAIIGFIGKQIRSKHPSVCLNPYRWRRDKMARYSSFETLELTAVPPQTLGWDVLDQTYMGRALRFKEHKEDIGFSWCESFEVPDEVMVGGPGSRKMRRLPKPPAVRRGRWKAPRPASARPVSSGLPCDRSLQTSDKPNGNLLANVDYSENRMIPAYCQVCETCEWASISLATTSRKKSNAVEPRAGSVVTASPDPLNPHIHVASERPHECSTTLRPCVASLEVREWRISGSCAGRPRPDQECEASSPTLEDQALSENDALATSLVVELSTEGTFAVPTTIHGALVEDQQVNSPVTLPPGRNKSSLLSEGEESSVTATALGIYCLPDVQTLDKTRPFLTFAELTPEMKRDLRIVDWRASLEAAQGIACASNYGASAV